MLIDPLTPSAVLPFENAAPVEPAEDDLPGLTIVVPIFNAGPLLERSLRSLLCNDLSGVEVIVMDGGSTDETSRILDHYEELFSLVVCEPDSGQSEAINKGFACATQPILYWLNGDDILLPDALLKVRRAFRSAPGAEVVVGNAAMTQLDLTPLHRFRFQAQKMTFEKLLDYANNHLVQPSVFFSEAAWRACGPLDESLHYAMDADLFLAMARRFRFLHLDEEIAYSVYHERTKTRGRRAESITELALVQARHGGLREARGTLDILVRLYHEALEGGGAAAGGPESTILARRLAALEAEVEKNRQLLLDLDLAPGRTP